jgi:EmrB/QacA subfamily drug resistance transporter
LGLAVFGVTSGVASFAGSGAELVFWRVAMGVGAAMVMPATLSTVRNIFPDHERKLAIGVWGAVAVLGVAFGPILGGFLLEQFGWGAIFWFKVPVAALAIGAAFFLIPEHRNPTAAPFDYPGALLTAGGVGGMVLGITEGPREGWTAPISYVPLVAGAVLLVALVLWERRARDPLINLGLFGNPRFSAASLSVAIAFSAFFGGIFVFTQYLQYVLGYDALEAGTRLAPLMLAVALSSVLGAPIASRFGSKAAIVGGLVFAAFGFALTAAITVETGYELLLACFVLMGLGIGVTGTAAADSILSAAPEENAGSASAMDETALELGGAFGLAVFGSTLTAGYTAAFVAGSLPPALATRASESIASAFQLASETTAGEQLLGAARVAFVEAMATTSIVGAGLIIVGALIALFFYPRDKKRGVGAST